MTIQAALASKIVFSWYDKFDLAKSLYGNEAGIENRLTTPDVSLCPITPGLLCGELQSPQQPQAVSPGQPELSKDCDNFPGRHFPDAWSNPRIHAG
ncbi:MAG: hypothetical protein U1F40_05095 [Turneriella sp.]